MSSRQKLNEAEIVSIIRSSPKGQLQYNNGWDQVPQAIWKLVSTAQAEAEQPKLAVIERAILTQKRAEVRRQRSIDAGRDYSPLGTSSGSGSRITLNENDSDSSNGNGDSNKEQSKQPRKQRAYGIRDVDGEYDDEAWDKELQLAFLADTINLHTEYKKNYDKEHYLKVAKNAKKKKEELKIAIEEINKKARDILVITYKEKQVEYEKSKLKEQALREKIHKDVEAKRVLFEEDNKVSDSNVEECFKQELEALKLLEEKAAALEAARLASAQTEAAKLAAIAAKTRAADEQKRQVELQQAAEAEKRQQVVELQKKQAEEAALKLKLEAEKRAAESKKLVESSSGELKGLILKEDIDLYGNCTKLLQQYEDATRDIAPSSTDPNFKKFYTNAVSCINTPLNTVANTDNNVISQRIRHFIDLIEGKPVVGSSAMTSPFQSSVLPNGKLFCLRLLAFRFVRKAESEILSERKGFAPLATVGINLCKQYPEWANLVQANFYKQCPFLVPFSFPKGNKTVQEYCVALGHDLKGGDSVLWNELVNRIKGYCALYASMVQTFEKNGQFDVGSSTSFFTIGGVWQILSKLMKLDPQPEVTVVVIQTLLELLSDDLFRTYGRQFQKLMHVLISVFLPKIDSVSVGSAKASVNRFQTFLEKKFRIHAN